LVNLQVIVRRQDDERRFQFLFLAAAVNFAFCNFASIIHFQNSPLGDFLPATASFVRIRNELPGSSRHNQVGPLVGDGDGERCAPMRLARKFEDVLVECADGDEHRAENSFQRLGCGAAVTLSQALKQ